MIIFIDDGGGGGGGGGISYVGANSSLSSGAVTLPGGVASGDLIYIAAYNVGSGIAVTTPSGYTQAYTGNLAVGQVKEFWKIAGSSESGPSISNCNAYVVIVLRGAASSPLGNVSRNSGQSASQTEDSLTCQETDNTSAILRFGISIFGSSCATLIPATGCTVVARIDGGGAQKITGGYLLAANSISGTSTAMCFQGSRQWATSVIEVKAA